MWRPEDYIVASLAALIITGLSVRLYGVVFQGLTLSSQDEELTESIISGTMAIISMYIGAKIQKHRDKDD